MGTENGPLVTRGGELVELNRMGHTDNIFEVIEMLQVILIVICECVIQISSKCTLQMGIFFLSKPYLDFKDNF